jgi:hypothetical protein
MDELYDKKRFQEHSEWIDKHLSKFYADDEVFVFHEIMSLDFHLDVYFIKSQKHSFNILLTSGMSSMEMDLNENIKNRNDLKFAELMLLLPKKIEFGEIYNGENENDWIISMLKQTARFPHHYGTWIGIGHTIQATEDFEAYDKKTEFVGSIILPSVTFNEDFTKIEMNDREINFYSLFPLYKNELEHKIEVGYNKFLDLLIKSNSKEILNIERQNLIPNKKQWNIFKRN